MDNKMYLYLENGMEFEGKAVGHQLEEPQLSEIVFNTSMIGYQEVITDPSYCFQSIVFTYPLIGNYGINLDDYETLAPSANSIVLGEYAQKPSNFRQRYTLEQFLDLHQIAGIHHVDTRMITKVIRQSGTMKSILFPNKLSESECKDLFKQDLRSDQIPFVSTDKICHFPSHGGLRIVMFDFGYKKNILESLLKRGCDVIVVPYNTSAEKVKLFNPQGIVLSNGPGDPMSITETIPVIQELQKAYPIFSICMGHQIFALANGAKTTKMKFGHRGSNQPVKDFAKNKVYITAQNHGYCVTEDSISGTDLEITQINLNDGTIEGLKHKTLPSFSVQYHPEASPGPNDTKFLFDQFIHNIKEYHA